MANKVGALIKEARTGAGMTQEQLSKKVDGATAADISKAERGEKELTQNQLKQIAKATGVTQASLLNAAKEGQSTASKKTTAKKTTSSSSAAKKTSSTSAAKKTSSTSAAKKTSSTSTARKTTAKKEEELKLSAAEKKLLELYRGADKETKEAALKVLKGEKLDNSLLSTILSGAGGGLLDGAMDLLGLGKK